MSCCQGVIILDGFQKPTGPNGKNLLRRPKLPWSCSTLGIRRRRRFSEAALKFNRKLRNHVTFSNVTCEMELNVECDSTSTGGTFNPWLWQVLLNCLLFFLSWSLHVCPRVSYYLLCYMGHICGLQCYDQFGRICSVLTVQKKAVDNFPVEQGSWKADIHSSSQEIPSLNGKWKFLIEKCLPLRAIVTLYPTLYIYIYIYIKKGRVQCHNGPQWQECFNEK